MALSNRLRRFRFEKDKEKPKTSMLRYIRQSHPNDRFSKGSASQSTNESKDSKSVTSSTSENISSSSSPNRLNTEIPSHPHSSKLFYVKPLSEEERNGHSKATAKESGFIGARSNFNKRVRIDSDDEEDNDSAVKRECLSDTDSPSDNLEIKDEDNKDSVAKIECFSDTYGTYDNLGSNNEDNDDSLAKIECISDTDGPSDNLEIKHEDNKDSVSKIECFSDPYGTSDNLEIKDEDNKDSVAKIECFSDTYGTSDNLGSKDEDDNDSVAIRECLSDTDGTSDNLESTDIATTTKYSPSMIEKLLETYCEAYPLVNKMEIFEAMERYDYNFSKITKCLDAVSKVKKRKKTTKKMEREIQKKVKAMKMNRKSVIWKMKARFDQSDNEDDDDDDDDDYIGKQNVYESGSSEEGSNEEEEEAQESVNPMILMKLEFFDDSSVVKSSSLPGCSKKKPPSDDLSIEGSSTPSNRLNTEIPSHPHSSKLFYVKPLSEEERNGHSKATAKESGFDMSSVLKKSPSTVKRKLSNDPNQNDVSNELSQFNKRVRIDSDEDDNDTAAKRVCLSDTDGTSDNLETKDEDNENSIAKRVCLSDTDGTSDKNLESTDIATITKYSPSSIERLLETYCNVYPVVDRMEIFEAMERCDYNFSKITKCLDAVAKIKQKKNTTKKMGREMPKKIKAMKMNKKKVILKMKARFDQSENEDEEEDDYIGKQTVCASGSSEEGSNEEEKEEAQESEIPSHPHSSKLFYINPPSEEERNGHSKATAKENVFDMSSVLKEKTPSRVKRKLSDDPNQTDVSNELSHDSFIDVSNNFNKRMKIDLDEEDNDSAVKRESLSDTDGTSDNLEIKDEDNNDSVVNSKCSSDTDGTSDNLESTDIATTKKYSPSMVVEKLLECYCEAYPLVNKMEIFEAMERCDYNSSKITKCLDAVTKIKRKKNSNEMKCMEMDGEKRAKMDKEGEIEERRQAKKMEREIQKKIEAMEMDRKSVIWKMKARFDQSDNEDEEDDDDDYIGKQKVCASDCSEEGSNEEEEDTQESVSPMSLMKLDFFDDSSVVELSSLPGCSKKKPPLNDLWKEGEKKRKSKEVFC